MGNRIHRKKGNVRYGSRVLAACESISNDTQKTGLNNNDIIVGNSGSGKTGGYVIPNIQNIDSSLVVSDTKNQLYRKFKALLESRGYRVYKIDFVNPDESDGYNPLKFIRRYEDGSYREQDVISLARMIEPGMDEKEPFWDMSAANYLAFLIALCLDMYPEEKHNMLQVCAIHRRIVADFGDEGIQKWLVRHPRSFATRRYAQIASYRPADKTWGSIMAFVNMALEPFDFKEGAALFANSKSIDIRELCTHKTAVFLNVSDCDRAYDALVNIFYAQTLKLLCAEADKMSSGKLKVPVRIIMDDFASGTKLPDFDKIISVIRSRDIYVSLIMQSLSQLESMYDRAASRTIINNCDHILYLGCQDLETAEFIATRVGKLPEVILGMPRNKAYLISAGEKARLVDKIAPYSTVRDSIPVYVAPAQGNVAEA